MKVIIPVAGVGAKLRPHTHTQPKTLVPIAGKPILAHIVDMLIDQGLKDFIFILGYLGYKIEDYISTRYTHAHNTFVVQEPRKGLAHAIWVCREQIKDEKEILIVLGDTIANFDVKEFLQSEYTIVGVKKVANPMSFGIAEINEEGFITKLVEKPKIPKSNLALVGIYKINDVPLLLSSIEAMIGKEGQNSEEYQLTDALMNLILKGEKIKAKQVDNWFDCGKKETLLAANAILLNIQGYKKSEVYKFSQTIVIPPVSIGEGCKIENSIIGPNVAIGDHTILQQTIVSDSIIGSFSELRDVVLKNSIIGNDSSLKGLTQSLNIGDNTEINFNQ